MLGTSMEARPAFWAARSAAYQGRGVHEAARIAGTAQGDEILVSSSVAAHVDSWALAGPRSVSLKGLSQPVDVFSVDWR
ncbi:MAG: hypothetical protein LC792_04780 [Actinobacteria bacterium]|nr:hypothetical protein [Actinomycetota bacterium]